MVTDRSKRILLVEASAEIRDFVGLLLTQDGYRVTAACSPVEAVARLAGERFDLIVCDGFRSGIDASADGSVAVLAAAGMTPVALFSGWGCQPEAVRAAGFAALLPKPFDFDAFDATIAQLINAQPETRRV